jgi:diaminopimelate decarboxylase
VIEPGKYLVSDAGFFVAEVTALKHSGRSEIAYLNTGFNHLKRPMYYGAYHHIWNLSNPEGVLKQYKVVGLRCFLNAGAYAMSMASNYNSRVRPAEVLIYEGKDFLIRRRETVTDITSTETDIDVI